MFGFFKRGSNSKNDTVIQEMDEVRDRFFQFIDKLETRLREFAEASLPELREMVNTDTDEFKRSYNRMKSAVLGQIENIKQKAYDVREEQVLPFQGRSETYFKFRGECYDRYNKLEELCAEYRNKIDQIATEDYEVVYKRILDEHESIKDKFNCSQCGTNIPIDALYFTNTYLTCPSCQTQNTFEPSSQAKLLEHIGRSLAEQRTAHILQEHTDVLPKIEELFQKSRKLKLSLGTESNRKIIAEKTAQMEELDRQRQELEQRSDQLYYQYLRTMFDEWSKINPLMKEEHERFYNRLLTEFNQSKNN